MVMIGSLFAGHEESPGKTVEVDGELFKEYYGSASDFNKGEYKHVEGKRILEPIKGPLAGTLVEMEQDVQSSISYAGGKKLMDIRKVNYVILGGDNADEHLLM
jgi:GMP reductase